MDKICEEDTEVSFLKLFSQTAVAWDWKIHICRVAWGGRVGRRGSEIIKERKEKTRGGDEKGKKYMCVISKTGQTR